MSFLPQEVLVKKRDGEALSREDIRRFIAGLTKGTVSHSQAAAFAMAVFFRNMTIKERVALTTAMRDSGAILDWSDFDAPVVDKHSTGGVGDNVSLMLAPMLASCGVYVPMISGRGLGHTGGTLDKFDSIPGYLTQPDNALFRRVTREAGCAIIGQTTELAPADEILYSIRDVTGTVESVPLITASILSKKLAAGLHALILDVKTGSGAFMPTLETSRELAESLVSVANRAGTRTEALITDMNEPLASAAGNALEVRNAVEFLKGTHRDPRLLEVTLALCKGALDLTGFDGDARRASEEALSSGAALERFARMVALLGGPFDFVEKIDQYLTPAPIVRDVFAPQDGIVTAIDTREVGMAVVALGGGRRLPTDTIDHAVGFDRMAVLGARIDRGQPLMRLHARDEDSAMDAQRRVIGAYTLGDTAPSYPLVADRISSQEAA